MSNFTVSVTTSSTVSGGAMSPGTLTGVYTLTGPARTDTIIDVGTTSETIVFGDISSPFCVALVNLDPTNYVDVARDSGMTNHITRLYPGTTSGMPCVFYPTTSTIYLKANTAACKVKMQAYDA